MRPFFHRFVYLLQRLFWLELDIYWSLHRRSEGIARETEGMSFGWRCKKTWIVWFEHLLLRLPIWSSLHVSIGWLPMRWIVDDRWGKEVRSHSIRDLPLHQWNHENLDQRRRYHPRVKNIITLKVSEWKNVLYWSNLIFFRYCDLIYFSWWKRRCWKSLIEKDQRMQWCSQWWIRTSSVWVKTVSFVDWMIFVGIRCFLTSTWTKKNKTGTKNMFYLLVCTNKCHRPL